MRLRAILPAAAFVAASLLSSSAFAGTISIGLQQTGVNGGAITTESTSNTGTAFFNGSYGTFSSNTISGTGSPTLAQGMLDTNSIQVSSSSAGTLYIYITETGLTSPTGLTSFLSSFTANTFQGNVTSVVESTFYDNSNAPYGGTQLATDTFTGAGTLNVANLATLGPLYSETVKYAVTVGAGGGNVNDTVNLTATAATPEPSSLALLGTGLIGAATTVLRRRKLSV